MNDLSHLVTFALGMVFALALRTLLTTARQGLEMVFHDERSYKIMARGLRLEHKYRMRFQTEYSWFSYRMNEERDLLVVYVGDYGLVVWKQYDRAYAA